MLSEYFRLGTESRGFSLEIGNLLGERFLGHPRYINTTNQRKETINEMHPPIDDRLATSRRRTSATYSSVRAP